MMTHLMIDEDALLPVHAYLDGELDTMNALAVEERMSTDPALAAECERIDALQRLMHGHLRREAPPSGLRRRIETAVGAQLPRARFAHTQFSWRALAASIAVTAFVASSSTSMLLAPSRSNFVRDSIVDAHLRALMASQPIDVASSDQHTVKPWFNGRIPQAPRVVDLAKEAFPLVGGRIDVIAENPVPSLVYAHRKHLISLTAVPDSGHANSQPVLSVVNGYNMYRWTEDGIAYWAVSDVAPADLDKFAELFRAMPPDQ
jgi:anti-sigma factor RsiW